MPSLHSSLLRLLCTLALFGPLAPAHADEVLSFIGYSCEPAQNRLVITYRSMLSKDVKGKPERLNEWQPVNLIASMRDESHIGSLRTIKRACALKGASYRLHLGPQPGNLNVQGRCGAFFTAWAQVWQGRKEVLPRHEMEGECGGEDDVTTRIEITPGAAPVITKVTQKEFYRM